MTLRISIIVAVIAVVIVPRVKGTGDAVRTFPTWEERVILELVNRARVAPATDLIGCTGHCSAAELLPTCYGAVAPLGWNFGLNQSSRFHSASMGKNAFFNHPTPFVVRSDIASVFPELCDGSASCASSGTGTTDPSVRIPLFGVTYSGEIIAAGYATPESAFYAWLYEDAPTATCSFSLANGHRYLILKNSGPGLGAGFASVPGSLYGTYYTGDFGGSGTPIPKIPSASHWGAAGSTAPNQRQSSSVEFWANWYDSAAPLQATVIVDSVSHALALARGTATNGAWAVSLGGLGTGCHRYSFSFQDSGGQTVRYPATGTLGVGPAGTCADWIGTLRSDFNGDVRSDILLRSTSGDVAEWQMNGTTITSGAVIGNPGTAYTVKSIGDYDGDVKADITLQNSTTGDVAIWLMNGNTIASGAVIGNPGPGWSVVGSGDIDGDSKADIVLQQASTGDVAVWLMNGTTITGGLVLGGPGPAWSVVGVGDFNGDGRADILLRNSSTGAIAEWQMNGLAISAAAVISNPGTAWVVKGVGDANGDGRADIFLRNSTTGDIAEWQMNGFTVTAGYVIGSPGTGYDMVGTADYNGDGNYDVLLRDASGNIVVWLLNGPAITAGAVVGSPGSSYVPVVK